VCVCVYNHYTRLLSISHIVIILMSHLLYWFVWKVSHFVTLWLSMSQFITMCFEGGVLQCASTYGKGIWLYFDLSVRSSVCLSIPPYVSLLVTIFIVGITYLNDNLLFNTLLLTWHLSGILSTMLTIPRLLWTLPRLAKKIPSFPPKQSHTKPP